MNQRALDAISKSNAKRFRSTDWASLRPDGTPHRETEYDKMKRQKDELIAKEKARIINEHELKRGGMRFAWLIEGAPGTYWIGRGTAEFGRDIADAVQFARMEDAERVLYWMVPEALRAVCRAVEHGFELPPSPGERL